MTEIDLEKLIAAVTERVLADLGGAGPCPDSEAGKIRCLAIGRTEAVPEVLRRGAVIRGLADYEENGNIRAYGRIVVTELTLLQLADIAQGRPGDSASGAVIDGLLEGVEIFLLESALPHRRRAGGGSPGLYAVLEGYVRTMQTFGVRLFAGERAAAPDPVPPRPPKYQAPVQTVPRGSARTGGARLLTEERALEMLKAGGAVRLERGTIVTPLAWDAFRRARAEVAFEGE